MAKKPQNRTASLSRDTKETRIKLSLALALTDSLAEIRALF